MRAVSLSSLAKAYAESRNVPQGKGRFWGWEVGEAEAHGHRWVWEPFFRLREDCASREWSGPLLHSQHSRDVADPRSQDPQPPWQRLCSPLCLEATGAYRWGPGASWMDALLLWRPLGPSHVGRSSTVVFPAILVASVITTGFFFTPCIYLFIAEMQKASSAKFYWEKQMWCSGIPYVRANFIPPSCTLDSSRTPARKMLLPLYKLLVYRNQRD